MPPSPPATRRNVAPLPMTKLLALNPGKAAPFCTQLPPSRAKTPSTLTAAVAVMAEPELMCRSPVLASAPDICMPPVFVPSPMVSDDAEMPASSAALKLRAVPDLVPRSMPRVLFKGLMSTLAPPAVPPKLMPPARLTLSACNVTVWPAMPLPISWLPLPDRLMPPAAIFASRLRLPLPTLTTPLPVTLAPERETLPPLLVMAASRLTFAPRP